MGVTDCEGAMTHRKKCDTSPAGEQGHPPLRTFSNRMSWGRRHPRRPVLPNALLRSVGATLAVARFLGDI